METIRISPKVAWSQVRKCVEEPGIHLSDPLTLPSARHVWNSMGERQHQSCWNDRFAAAVMCGMDEQSQRIAAWAAVSNGLIGYWEWKTRNQLQVGAALKYIGIEYNDLPQTSWRFPAYSYLRDELCRSLIIRFNLPTLYFSGGNAQLTEEQEMERLELNRHYPLQSLL